MRQAQSLTPSQRKWVVVLRRGGGAYALDYIYAWKLERAFAGYELVASEGDARLYAKAR